MNSSTSLRDRSNPPTASRTSADAQKIATPLSEAANEDLFWNPMWVVALGLVCLFVILAFLTSG